jgi:general secretion pathway protein I
MTNMSTRIAKGRRGGTVSRGLTLLEVLIALVIIATALVALVNLENQDIRAIDKSRRVTLATMLARNMMTQIEIGGFPEEMGEEEGDFRESELDEELQASYAGFRWRTVVESAEFEGVTLENARRVTVTVFWTEGNQERQLDVVTYIANRGEPPE